MFDFFSYYLILIGIICDSNSNKADIASLSRDAFGRINPNELVAGYFPAWAVVLLILSGMLIDTLYKLYKLKETSVFFLLTLLFILRRIYGSYSYCIDWLCVRMQKSKKISKTSKLIKIYLLFVDSIVIILFNQSANR